AERELFRALVRGDDQRENRLSVSHTLSPAEYTENPPRCDTGKPLISLHARRFRPAPVPIAELCPVWAAVLAKWPQSIPRPTQKTRAPRSSKARTSAPHGRRGRRPRTIILCCFSYRPFPYRRSPFDKLRANGKKTGEPDPFVLSPVEARTRSGTIE